MLPEERPAATDSPDPCWTVEHFAIHPERGHVGGSLGHYVDAENLVHSRFQQFGPSRAISTRS